MPNMIPLIPAEPHTENCPYSRCQPPLKVVTGLGQVTEIPCGCDDGLVYSPDCYGGVQVEECPRCKDIDWDEPDVKPAWVDQPKPATARERVALAAQTQRGRRGRPGGDPWWVAEDVAVLRDEYARGEITMQQLEDGLDDVFGVNGGIGHARACMIDLPSGSCTCGGWKNDANRYAPSDWNPEPSWKQRILGGWPQDTSKRTWFRFWVPLWACSSVIGVVTGQALF